MWRCALVVLAAVLCAAQDDPRAWMARGMQAFKNARYAEAISDFQQALNLAPDSKEARQYLAIAYVVQYIPGANTPENVEIAAKAEENFRKLLDQDPQDKTAIRYLASLKFQQASALPVLQDKIEKLREAREWYEKLASVDPHSKEAFYSVGVIDWAEAYPQWTEARAQSGLSPQDPGPIATDKLRREVRAKLSPLYEDGIRQLTRALDLDPQYDDAMAYMNLIIREQADLADTKEEYQRAIADADTWVQKALEAKKTKQGSGKPVSQ